MSAIDVLYSLEFPSNRTKVGSLAYFWNRAVRLLVDAVAKVSFARGSTESGISVLPGNDIVLSLTSMPERLPQLRLCLESLFRQSLKPCTVILWAESESIGFWEESLRLYTDRGLEIRGIEDLKPHKKYFQAFKEFRDKRIVVVDDDVYYPSYLIKKLAEASELYPGCVICGRCHKMSFDVNGELEPYNSWEGNYDCQTPRFDVVPTGVGGVLYRPSLFSEDMLDAELIKDVCLFADDLWLKTMEVSSGIPCVRPHMRNIEYAPVRCGARVRQLAESNVQEGRNDIYIGALDERYGLSRLVYGLCSGVQRGRR